MADKTIRVIRQDVRNAVKNDGIGDACLCAAAQCAMRIFGKDCGPAFAYHSCNLHAKSYKISTQVPEQFDSIVYSLRNLKKRKKVNADTVYKLMKDAKALDIVIINYEETNKVKT
jgi:hypothetical protein